MALKLSMKTILKDAKGVALKNEEKEDMTLSEVLTNLLSYSTKNHHRCYLLAQKVATQDTVDFKAEDVVFIKEIINESTTLASITGGQIIDLLSK